MTFLLAAILLIICVLLLSVGKWLTGKNRFHIRRCGRPEEGECSLCNKKKCKKEKR